MMKIIKDIMDSVGGTIILVFLSVVSFSVALRIVILMSLGEMVGDNYMFLLLLLLLLTTFMIGKIVSGGGKKDKKYEKAITNYDGEYGTGLISKDLTISKEEADEVDSESENNSIDSLALTKELHTKFEDIRDGVDGAEDNLDGDDTDDLSGFGFELELKDKLRDK